MDASLSGLGTVLSQEQNGKVRLVAYASRALTPTERNMPNYSSMRLEFFGLKWAMTEKFWDYLLGQKCVLWTNNNPRSHLNTAKLGATEQCWAAQVALMLMLTPFLGSITMATHRQIWGHPSQELPSQSL